MIASDSIKYLRQIQSFVRREGRLTPNQARALARLSDQYLLQPTDTLNFPNVYQNKHPIIAEIGFGMGHSLVQQALNHPDTNYLGFEVHRPGIGSLLSDIERHSLTNIRIIAADAVAYWHYIPDASLSGVQIFFPDPWHKKRHHKRRLIQAQFVMQLAKKIKVDGFLHCATDWQNYAEQMCIEIDATQCFTEAKFIARPTSRPITKFEQRGLRLGHSVWDVFAIQKRV